MGEAIDELAVVEELPDGQLAESVDDVTLYAEYRRVTADQAALRRLATLVAQGRNRPRCSRRSSTKCAAVRRRIPPDCGAMSQTTK